MIKVFIVHGYHGWPNGAWRPWLMSELNQKEIYCCALSMPKTENPKLKDWINEIARVVEDNKDDEIYLVGHSLGSTAILRYLEKASKKISGAVLVSGPISAVENKDISEFLNEPFDFKKIKSMAENFLIIHGEVDTMVPFDQGQTLARELDCDLVKVENGGHLTGSEGWRALPQVLEGLSSFF